MRGGVELGNAREMVKNDVEVAVHRVDDLDVLHRRHHADVVLHLEGEVQQRLPDKPEAAAAEGQDDPLRPRHTLRHRVAQELQPEQPTGDADLEPHFGHNTVESAPISAQYRAARRIDGGVGGSERVTSGPNFGRSRCTPAK